MELLSIPVTTPFVRWCFHTDSCALTRTWEGCVHEASFLTSQSSVTRASARTWVVDPAIPSCIGNLAAHPSQHAGDGFAMKKSGRGPSPPYIVPDVCSALPASQARQVIGSALGGHWQGGGLTGWCETLDTCPSAARLRLADLSWQPGPSTAPRALAAHVPPWFRPHFDTSPTEKTSSLIGRKLSSSSRIR